MARVTSAKNYVRWCLTLQLKWDTQQKIKEKENRKLAVFIENMEYETEDQFGYDIVLGFKQNAFRHNWDVTVIPVTPAFQLTEKYDTYMLKNGFCGAFLVGFALHDEWMQQLSHTTMPTVLFDNYIEKIRTSATSAPITMRASTRP